MYANFHIPARYTGPCSGKDNEDLYGNRRVGNIYNSYYQWVPIYLIFLAVLFYLPRYMWLTMEGGLMKFFGNGTTTKFIEDPEEKRHKLVKVTPNTPKFIFEGYKHLTRRLVISDPINYILNCTLQFFKDNVHNRYNIYYFGFIFCEFLNLLVVCLAMALTQRFLEHRFLFYGFKVWMYYR